MIHEQYTRAIRRSAATGLWGSVACIGAASLFYYVAPWRFYPSAGTSRALVVAGSVLAVLALAAALLVVRRQIPVLRQSEAGLEAKLKAYAAHVSSLYLSMLGVVAVLSVLMVVAWQSALLMLAIVATLFLILNYPNIYRVKVDLGLGDDEMRLLYGDRYINNSTPDE